MRVSSILTTVILTCAQYLAAMPVADTAAPAEAGTNPPRGDDGLHTWHPPRPARLVCDWPMTFKRCSEWTNQGWAFAPGAFCGYDATPGFRNPDGRDKAECARLCRCEIDRRGLKERDEEGVAAAAQD